MSRRQSQTPEEKSAVAVEETSEPVIAREFTDVSFTSPMLRVVQQTIGKFVNHLEGCDRAEACSCGLTAAFSELERREMLLKRYGTLDE